ncbi:MAG: hypothetical protein IAI49_13005, partial [Candidatus Eremiobacteraeota bacterium]|nr:hypothetical protein [Candidatus Eremiobacteraeota bacterium]
MLLLYLGASLISRSVAVVFALGSLALAVSSLGGARATAKAATAKMPLDYTAYDGWKAIRGTALSDDGRYAAYALVPEDGDPTLIVHDFRTGVDLSEARGMDPVFTADGRYVVYTLRAPNAAIHKASREHKKAEEQPKNGLGILDVAAGTARAVERVKDFKIAPDPGDDTLAYELESPLPSPAATASATAPVPPSAAASPNASPSASPSPDDLHKKESGATLVVRDLAAAAETRLSGVTAYAVSHDGDFVAYTVQSKDGKLDGAALRTTAGGAITYLLRAPGHYKNLTFASKSDRLAFVSDSATFGSPAPRYALYQSDLTGDPSRAAARVLVDGATANFTDAPPSENGTLRYSKDGARLFFGVAAAPTPVPSGTPDPVKVDIWNWQDDELQSMQRKRADEERKRTAEAVVLTDGTRATRLARGNVRTIVANENPNVALGVDDVRYERQRSWDSDYNDVYAISLRDGSRRLLVSKQRDEQVLSPNGAYVVAYDPVARAWFSVSTGSAKRTDLTSRLKRAFYDERDDHPAAPPPYGFAGWIDGDRYVLLRDRYDVWAVDPQSGSARLLTGGVGRRRHIVFETVRVDPAADSFDSTKPIVLHARNDDTKDQGIWRVMLTGRAAFVPQPVTMVPKAVAFAA